MPRSRHLDQNLWVREPPALERFSQSADPHRAFLRAPCELPNHRAFILIPPVPPLLLVNPNSCFVVSCFSCDSNKTSTRTEPAHRFTTHKFRRRARNSSPFANLFTMSINHRAIAPGASPVLRSNRAPTAPTAHVARSSPSLCRRPKTASMPVQCAPRKF